jgi:molybdenum cofactor cytidylyltransferase
MQLSQALRLPVLPRLALVGAGGKTTAAFLLARELLQIQTESGDTAPRGGNTHPSVLVTTTTHLGASQGKLADRQFIVHSAQELADLERKVPPGVVLVTGPGLEGNGDRVSGLEGAALERFLSFADANALPLIIEADGSRLHPLKAPADHEPALPGFVDAVLVVAGLSGLGKPLDAGWVHRPERFSEYSGLPLGAEITVEALARVLIHPLGGLKNIPPHARRMVLLTQADSEDLRSQADVLAGQLIPAFDTVVVCSLGKLDGVNPGTAAIEVRIYSVHKPVAGVILAAGRAARYGQPKLLLTWRGEPLVRQVAKKALQAGLKPVVVVTGAMREAVQAATQDLDVIQVYNPDWEQGQSTSVKAGLQALPTETGGAIFLLADMPQVPVELIRALVKQHAQTLHPLVAPSVAGQRANPVLFDRSAFPALFELQGDRGGRVLFNAPDRFPVTWVSWDDPAILLDVDTPEDYARLLELE